MPSDKQKPPSVQPGQWWQALNMRRPDRVIRVDGDEAHFERRDQCDIPSMLAGEAWVYHGDGPAPRDPAWDALMSAPTAEDISDEERRVFDAWKKWRMINDDRLGRGQTDRSIHALVAASLNASEHGRTLGGIARDTGLSWPDVQAAVTILVATGEAEPRGDGVYALSSGTSKSTGVGVQTRPSMIAGMPVVMTHSRPEWAARLTSERFERDIRRVASLPTKAVPGEVLINFIVNVMRDLTPSERNEVMSHFCQVCGSDNPSICRCWEVK